MKTKVMAFLLAAAVGFAFAPGIVAGIGDDEEVPSPGKNTPGEPLAKSFSMDKAMTFLDRASLRWQQVRKCMTCHTNYAYLMTVPEHDPERPALKKVRSFAEGLVKERWETKGPRWDAEVVMTAMTLAVSDRSAGEKLHPLTRKALDRMWTVQREDGGWNWLKCNWPPMESDDHFGATIALIGAGAAPGDYASTPAARKGIEKARAYLEKNPPPTLHHEAMIFWASTVVDGLLDRKKKRETIDRLLALQRPDGGWSLASMGDWKRSDGKEQEPDKSDGYGTGFVIFLARKAGVPASDARLRQGIAWLKSHQRESGRWFTRSLNKDNRHYITHAGTAFAVLAIRACEEGK